MKTYVLTCLLGYLLVITSTASGKTGKRHHKDSPGSSGIYASVADYRMGKLTLATECQFAKDRFQLNEFLGKPYITVHHGGRKYTYMKDAIFGFRDCEGRDFRFYNHQLFEIEEPNTIVIYRQIKLETGGGNKGVKPMSVYYFSNGLAAEIHPLTRTELEAAFPGNDKFHDLLEMYYKDDLSSYDAYHHTYKVNRLLQAAN